MRPTAHPIRPGLRQQRGAAALIVVMLLFFVISLVAAYTSRNLIFEQRTATNQYRATQALEAAEAGVEWALAQLNGGRVTNSCGATTDTTNESFRQRYLGVNASTGQTTPRAASGGGSVTPRCVFDGTSGTASAWGWTCNCPQPNTPSSSLTGPTGGGAAPAFIVRFIQPASLGTRLDLIQIDSNSCTRLGTDCLNFGVNRGATGDGVASVRATLALRGALTRVPPAPLTVIGSLSAPPVGVVLSVSNQDVPSNGVTVHSGAAMPGSGLALTGLPGTPAASTTIASDATLAPAAQTGFLANDLRFASYFGMRPQTYLRQPGLPVINCSTGCDAAAINTALSLNPGRPVWLSGGGTVSIDADVGTVAVPALLIVEGDLALSNGVTVRGLIYQRVKADLTNSTWSVAGGATILGAAIAEGNLALVGTSATPAVVYEPALLRALRVSIGTYVRVPGSWRDFL